jgi:hypothetical protein
MIKVKRGQVTGIIKRGNKAFGCALFGLWWVCLKMGKEGKTRV